MALVEWSDTYSVNIAEIDQEHQQLAQLTNELHEAMMEGKAKDVMSEVLDRLIQYALSHFATEERYFDLYDYPGAAQHKMKHAELVEQVSVLQKKFESGEKVLTIHVLNFLRDWIHDHILGYDKLFGPFLNDKGIY